MKTIRLSRPSRISRISHIHRASHRHRRSAFTLLELLAVIAIIAILLSLIVPALRGVLVSGDEAAVTAELSQLDQALTSFKAKFGDYPPSSLQIPASGGTWDAKSRAAILAIWPQFDFGSRGGLDSASPVPGALNLSGAECLVFFLGGMQGGSADAPVLAGFSKNPLTPWTVSGNPDGPFMEFDLSRVTNISGSPSVLYEYLDPMPDQTAPIMYVSAAGGRYNKTTDAAAHDDYDVFGDGDSRNMLGCYMQADGSTPHQKDGFQLISPGADGAYGEGGAFTPGEDLPSARDVEEDNITNFSGGTLN